MLKFFLLQPNTTGAICASSKYLAEMITANVGLSSAHAVVEIGPGTGAFTGQIREKISPDCRFFAVEINPDMESLLLERFENLDLCIGSAALLGDFMKERDISFLDNVISGLPWACFPESLQDELLTAITQSLKPGGYFTTFSYVKPPLPKDLKFRAKLKKYFSKIEKTPVVWRNMPPAFVFRCVK